MNDQTSNKLLIQRLVGVMLEIIIAGMLAVFYTEIQDTGRGFQPNPVFWKAFIVTHMTFLLVIPLFFNGRTLGMLLSKVTVASNHGKNVNVLQIFSRAILGFGPVVLTNGLWYFVSVITAVIDKKGRGWGEIVSFTTIKSKNRDDLI